MQTAAVFLLLSSLLSFLGRPAAARAMAEKVEDRHKSKSFVIFYTAKLLYYNFLGRAGAVASL